MEPSLIQWMKQNIGKKFQSPRKTVFKSKRALEIKVVSVDNKSKCLNIDFIGGKSKALPLYYWMFDRTIFYLRENMTDFMILGAKPQPPYLPRSIEGEIWKEPRLHKSTYKVSSHICDVLVLAGIAQYGYATNPQTGRNLQGAKYLDSTEKKRSRHHESKLQNKRSKQDPKNAFLSQYKTEILNWINANEDFIVESRAGYSWNKKSTLECVKSRNEMSRKIILSRIKNSGGVDLDTLDQVTKWGFGRKFPLRDPKIALKISRQAFEYLDKDLIKEAAITLMKIHNVGISRVSKILGLYDQENLCIYDSRVGNALKDLKHSDEKIILCPPGYGREYDVVSRSEIWAEYYEKLIWALEIMRDYLNEMGCTYRLADVEMALFMMGK